MSSSVKTTTTTTSHLHSSSPSNAHTTAKKTTTNHADELHKRTYVHTSESAQKIEIDLRDAKAARPHARKVVGSVVSSEFKATTSVFVFEYTAESSQTEPAEIFVPYVHYPGGYRVTASDGHCTIEKHEGYDIIKHEHDNHGHHHRVVVERAKRHEIEPSQFSWASHSTLPVYIALGFALIQPYVTW